MALAALIAMAALGGVAAGDPKPAKASRVRPGWGASAGRLAGPGSSDQAVAVAYLDPGIVLSLDVVTGRLVLSGTSVGFAPGGAPWSHQRPVHADEPGVVGIYDPLDHGLYRYAGGIPGFASASGVDAAVGLRAPAAAPLWTRPRLLSAGGRALRLVFPDGRRVGVVTDAAGRVRVLRWPGPHGEALRTSVQYRRGLTVIADPFGVQRTYEHRGENRAFEVVPAAWQNGPGYRHWIAPVLDGARETGWVQYRTAVQRPRPRVLIDDLAGYGGPEFAGVSFDSPANGGYIDVNLSGLGRAEALDREMLERGLLDVTAIRPTFNSAAQIRRIDRRLRPRLTPMIRDCHLDFGQGAVPFMITVARTLTAGERVALDDALRGLNAWAVISVGGSSRCAVASAAASTR